MDNPPGPSRSQENTEPVDDRKPVSRVERERNEARNIDNTFPTFEAVEGGATLKAAERKLLKKSKKRKKDLNVLKQEIVIDDHIIPIDQFYARYNTDPEKGLDQDDAYQRLKQDGLNELTPPKTTPQILIFCKHLFSGFAIILWCSAILCFVSYFILAETSDDPDKSNVYLGIIVLIVVIATGIFGYIQDRTSTKIMDSFKKMITQSATVIRNGKAIHIPSEYLVKGDVILIKFGNKVPADVRIVECFGMKVDNSSLTGETEPQPRGTEMTNTNPMETQNLAFYSTNVMEGTCKAVVFEVGDKTVIGRLATLTVGLSRGDSPMTIEIKHFVKLITIVALVMSLVFVIIALALQNGPLECVIYFIALVVANIPEGLLLTVTLALTLTAKKMAKKNCLIKCLDSVETLGSTSTICSDKTGTLTQNRMTVLEIVYNFRIFGIKYSLNRSTTVDNEFNLNDPDFQNLTRCARLCLRAMFDYTDSSETTPVLDRNVEGDASEAGILKCLECIFKNVEAYQRDNPKLMEIPFNSTNKYQLSIHRTSTGNVLFMKGAPEKILDLCSTVSVGGKSVALTPQTRQQMDDILIELGSKGERVLGFCDAELKDPADTVYDVGKKNYPTNNLRFVGLMALIDPPREAVPDAVAKCKTAGIRVIMVTGDHPVTAEAIARKVGIISGDTVKDAAKRLKVPAENVPKSEVKAIVVPGDRLRQMTNDELDEVLMYHEEIVFARTTPTQKLLIVEGCQRLGYITAVTGDGVNDSPALKKADIGVAMGIAGSDVSKQAADMVLLDDNFASIVTGVEQGRIIFDNLKKSIAYVLTSNIPEMAPFVAYIIFLVPMPLTVIAILIVDVGTDMLPAISLAYEQAESDIMKRRPRNPFYDKLVNRRLIWMAYGQIGIIQTAAAFAGYFLVMAQHGFFPGELLGIRDKWENEALLVTDSYGQQWGYDSRRFCKPLRQSLPTLLKYFIIILLPIVKAILKDLSNYKMSIIMSWNFFAFVITCLIFCFQYLEHYCQSCFFAAIVVTQLADVVICKTRRNSIVHQKMKNWVLNAGMAFAVFLGCFILYCPHLEDYLLMPPIRFVHWLPGVPFALLIIIFDETRRYIIRSRPGGWCEREFYY